MEKSSPPNFVGMADDIAGLAIQRMLTCETRRSAYRRVAKRWQRASALLAVVTSVVASLAAVAVVRDSKNLAVGFSLAIAVLVPLQEKLNARGRANANLISASGYEALGNRFETFCQLDLGPWWWTGGKPDANRLRAAWENLDEEFSGIASSSEHVSTTEQDVVAAHKRVEPLVKYLDMPNVAIPAAEVWRY